MTKKLLADIKHYLKDCPPKCSRIACLLLKRVVKAEVKKVK